MTHFLEIGKLIGITQQVLSGEGTLPMLQEGLIARRLPAKLSHQHAIHEYAESYMT